MSAEQRSLDFNLLNLAKDLHATRKVHSIYGIAGDPITPLIGHAEALGIHYFGFRNEQAASYAASAISFLTRGNEIGACLTVAGPGMINALTGVANAKANGWPMLLICPFTPSPADFQYVDQLEAIKGLAKAGVFYDGNSSSVSRAVELACSPPCGGVVLFVTKALPPPRLEYIHPRSQLALHSVIPEISSSSNVLLVIGAGAVLRPSVDQVLKRIVETYGVPFVADPMARGIIPESHPLCVTAARSTAFRTASTAILVGNKLDWMLGHGREPKWSDSCKFLIFTDEDDACVSEEVQNRTFRFALSQLSLVENIAVDDGWRRQVLAAVSSNKSALEQKLVTRKNGKLPSHHEAIGAIREVIDSLGMQDTLVVSEGANTMDVTRVALDRITHPCKRLDAGRWGTMGCGLGFVLAACALNPNEPVICIQGDSAFGFSGMEIESIVRYKCKAVVIVFNNGGIYTGVSDNATSFNKGIKHEDLIKAFGGVGMSTCDGDAHAVVEVMRQALTALNRGVYPILVDITIDPASGTQSGSLSRL